MIRFRPYLLTLLFICQVRPSAVGGTSADSLKSYLGAGALALSTASEPDGQKAFAIFRQAVAAAAKQNGDTSVAGIVTSLTPGKPVPVQHHAIASQLLRRYFLARYGERLGTDLSTLLTFCTEAQPNQENWYLPEFMRQRKWLEQKAAELGLAFKSYDGRVDEMTLAGGDSIIAILTHGDVVDVDGQTWSSPPWEGRVADGKVIGRGAMDDKGPIIPALYAIAALRDCGWQLSSTLKLLVANAEETDWSDVQYYLKNAPTPQYTIGMDGTFPVTHGQKAYALITFKSDSSNHKPSSAPWQLLSLSGGSSPGIIPEEGLAVLIAKRKKQTTKSNLETLAQKWCKAHPPAKILIEQAGDSFRLKAIGKGGHAAIPENGHNALGDLTAFLVTLDLEMDKWGAFAVHWQIGRNRTLRSITWHCAYARGDGTIDRQSRRDPSGRWHANRVSQSARAGRDNCGGNGSARQTKGSGVQSTHRCKDHCHCSYGTTALRPRQRQARFDAAQNLGRNHWHNQEADCHRRRLAIALVFWWRGFRAGAVDGSGS